MEATLNLHLLSTYLKNLNVPKFQTMRIVTLKDAVLVRVRDTSSGADYECELTLPATVITSGVIDFRYCMVDNFMKTASKSLRKNKKATVTVSGKKGDTLYLVAGESSMEADIKPLGNDNGGDFKPMETITSVSIPNHYFHLALSRVLPFWGELRKYYAGIYYEFSKSTIHMVATTPVHLVRYRLFAPSESKVETCCNTNPVANETLYKFLPHKSGLGRVVLSVLQTDDGRGYFKHEYTNPETKVGIKLLTESPGQFPYYKKVMDGAMSGDFVYKCKVTAGNLTTICKSAGSSENQSGLFKFSKDITITMEEGTNLVYRCSIVSWEGREISCRLDHNKLLKFVSLFEKDATLTVFMNTNFTNGKGPMVVSYGEGCKYLLMPCIQQ